MGPKIIKNTLLGTIVMAVLCAGTVSARQMRSQTKAFACFGECSATTACYTGCHCHQTSETYGVCEDKLDEPELKSK